MTRALAVFACLVGLATVDAQTCGVDLACNAGNECWCDMVCADLGDCCAGYGDNCATTLHCGQRMEITERLVLRLSVESPAQSFRFLAEDYFTARVFEFRGGDVWSCEGLLGCGAAGPMMLEAGKEYYIDINPADGTPVSIEYVCLDDMPTDVDDLELLYCGETISGVVGGDGDDAELAFVVNVDREDYDTQGLLFPVFAQGGDNIHMDVLTSTFAVIGSCDNEECDSILLLSGSYTFVLSSSVPHEVELTLMCDAPPNLACGETLELTEDYSYVRATPAGGMFALVFHNVMQATLMDGSYHDQWNCEGEAECGNSEYPIWLDQDGEYILEVDRSDPNMPAYAYMACFDIEESVEECRTDRPLLPVALFNAFAIPVNGPLCAQPREK